MEPSIRFTVCRPGVVNRLPRRAGDNEAGIDFFIPEFLSVEDIEKANSGCRNSIYIVTPDMLIPPRDNVFWNICLVCDENSMVEQIFLAPNSRVVIPSGIRVLLTPNNSMLMAANKSGISTKKGFIYGAEIVDSTYTGEVHLSLINTSDKIDDLSLKNNKAVLQFIHVPIYLTKLENIDNDKFNEIAKNWSERGSNWQGSTDNKEPKEGELFEIEPYNENID